ncbi:MAG: hypothetical protein A2X11_06365 [Bacteroidetes bacterium GWE2_42_24]|nr:MAG: hypothetical protein A2X11_06365 [Bacteroidetes bacterium GWE2_42_24]OFY25566.1 MAG: hypothetical protein A2X09_13310 [Bacteroidetes bacterium GWF2_43_11]
MACSKDNEEVIQSPKLSVIFSDIPFKTEKFSRIGYVLKMWEFKKDGLLFEKLRILDNHTKDVLMVIDKTDSVVIHSSPIKPNGYFVSDQIDHYYMSVQLPIPVTQSIPSSIAHQLVLKDTVHDTEVIVDGAIFSPRSTETPISILSPVKGYDWLFINQSTMQYHFNTMFFVDGSIYTGERFAFDNVRIDSTGEIRNGDPAVNESYYNYKDTLFAVADGSIEALRDGRPENSGNQHDVVMNSIDEMGGNYLVLKIDNNHYALYAHCVPGSFLVSEGQTVHEGDPIALLGNSGNSDCPHVHFQITDSPNLFFSRGLPFVLKEWTKIGEIATGRVDPPVRYYNCMMEELTIISFD